MAWNSLPDFIRGIQRAAQTVLAVYLKRSCSRVTSASSALGVLNHYALYKSTHSLTITHSIWEWGARLVPLDWPNVAFTCVIPINNSNICKYLLTCKYETSLCASLLNMTLLAAAARAPAVIDRYWLICCTRPRSAANQPHVAAAVDRRDRQTDGRTDTRPLRIDPALGGQRQRPVNDYVGYVWMKEWMNEYFIYQHRYNTVKSRPKERTVSTEQKGSKSTYNCAKM